MSVRVLSLAEIVGRIRDAGIYRSVGGAAELARAAQTGALGSPLAFVLPGAETVEPSGFAGGVAAQAVVARVIVLSVAEDIRRDAGAAALSALEAARAALIGSLCVWRPDWADAPVEHDRGQLVTGAMPGGLLGWQDDFRLRFRRSIIPGG